MVGRFAKPANCLRVILRDTFGVVVGKPKSVLGDCVPLLGGFAIPLRGLRIILRDFFAFSILLP